MHFNRTLFKSARLSDCSSAVFEDKQGSAYRTFHSRKLNSYSFSTELIGKGPRIFSGRHWYVP